MTDRMQAAQSMTATQCRTTFCGHVHVPAVFHMAAGARPAEFTPVPGTGIPLPPARRWLAVIGAVGQPRDGDPAACYALLHARRSTLTYIRVAYDIDAAARKIVRALPRLAPACTGAIDAADEGGNTPLPARGSRRRSRRVRGYALSFRPTLTRSLRIGSPAGRGGAPPSMRRRASTASARISSVSRALSAENCGLVFMR